MKRYILILLVEVVLAFEELEEEIIVKEEKKTPDGLGLKELPKNLRYAFLGENDTKLAIVLAHLSEQIYNKLLGVLKQNMEALLEVLMI